MNEAGPGNRAASSLVGSLTCVLLCLPLDAPAPGPPPYRSVRHSWYALSLDCPHNIQHRRCRRASDRCGSPRENAAIVGLLSSAPGQEKHPGGSGAETGRLPPVAGAAEKCACAPGSGGNVAAATAARLDGVSSHFGRAVLLFARCASSRTRRRIGKLAAAHKRKA